MPREKVGMVTAEEKEEVLHFYERIRGLDELLLMLDGSPDTQEARDELQKKIVADMQETKMKLQNWWAAMSQKYAWKSIEDGNWSIDFKTNEIYCCLNAGTD